MGFLPKVLFAVLLLLPGGLIVGPAILFVQRWYARRALSTSQPAAQSLLPVNLHRDSAIAHSQAPA